MLRIDSLRRSDGVNKYLPTPISIPRYHVFASILDHSTSNSLPSTSQPEEQRSWSINIHLLLIKYITKHLCPQRCIYDRGPSPDWKAPNICIDNTVINNPPPPHHRHHLMHLFFFTLPSFLRLLPTRHPLTECGSVVLRTS